MHIRIRYSECLISIGRPVQLEPELVMTHRNYGTEQCTSNEVRTTISRDLITPY